MTPKAIFIERWMNIFHAGYRELEEAKPPESNLRAHEQKTRPNMPHTSQKKEEGGNGFHKRSTYFHPQTHN